MFCGECGTQNPDINQFCKNCGKPLKKRQAPGAQPATISAPQAATSQPVYNPPPAATNTMVAAAPAAAPASVKPSVNKGIPVLAIISIAAGIGSWFRYPYLLAILAIVLGGVVIAKTENRKGAIVIVAIFGILIGLACIVVDLFYFTIFPIPHVDL